MLIMGVDPGSRVIGCGLVHWDGSQARYAAGERLALAGEDLPQRLYAAFHGVRGWIERHAPDEMALEAAFVGRNAATALKLGKACGVVTAAAALAGLSLVEYAPRRIKQAVVGVGGADKSQVQYMVMRLLGAPAPLDSDVADALAVAVCHAHSRSSNARLERALAR